MSDQQKMQNALDKLAALEKPDWTKRTLECAGLVRDLLAIPAGTSPVALVLGSGLGAFADSLSNARGVAFTKLPHFPMSTVQGHKGRLVFGEQNGVPVLALQGRLHGYEGHDAATVAFPARVMAALGARALLVTNAAGGCNPEFKPGDLMRITDHLNLTGKNPLIGHNEDALGPRFPDLSRAYDPRLGAAMVQAAMDVGVALKSGVYAQMNGPSYETPAEVRMARILGADAVGMSTVPEVIVAAHMGMPCAGISCITNLAAGLSPQPLSHQEVMEVAAAVEKNFLALLGALVGKASAAVPERKSLV